MADTIMRSIWDEVVEHTRRTASLARGRELIREAAALMSADVGEANYLIRALAGQAGQVADFADALRRVNLVRA